VHILPLRHHFVPGVTLRFCRYRYDCGLPRSIRRMLNITYDIEDLDKPLPRQLPLLNRQFRRFLLFCYSLNPSLKFSIFPWILILPPNFNLLLTILQFKAFFGCYYSALLLHNIALYVICHFIYGNVYCNRTDIHIALFNPIRS
jgi:hypothetical protein